MKVLLSLLASSLCVGTATLLPAEEIRSKVAPVEKRDTSMGALEIHQENYFRGERPIAAYIEKRLTAKIPLPKNQTSTTRLLVFFVGKSRVVFDLDRVDVISTQSVGDIEVRRLGEVIWVDSFDNDYHEVALLPKGEKIRFDPDRELLKAEAEERKKANQTLEKSYPLPAH